MTTHGRALPTVAEALRTMLDAVVPVSATERVALSDAHARVLATRVVASTCVPAFDRALMDGYAVHAVDTAGASDTTPVMLDYRTTTYTGMPAAGALARGTCVGIATGAALPPGADAVVVVEHTTREDTRVRVTRSVHAGQHIGLAGSDIRPGDTLADTDTLLTPARLGALAASGTAAVTVYARPRIAIVSTGDEIVQAGTPLAAAQVYDVNRVTLPPLAQMHGAEVNVYDTLRDDPDSLHAFLDATADADLLVLTGGSSVGEHDYVARVLAARGEVLVHGVAVKPGKPTLCARLGRQLVLGLPGNPTSCLVNAYVFLIPMLRRLSRWPAYTPTTCDAVLSRDVANASGRHVIFSVRLDGDVAVPAFKGSGDITSLSQADGYIEIPATTSRLEAGTQVRVTLF